MYTMYLNHIKNFSSKTLSLAEFFNHPSLMQYFLKGWLKISMKEVNNEMNSM